MAKKTPIKSNTSDVVVSSLKKRWFDLAAKEKYPNTPDLSKELDNIEGAIKEMELEAASKKANS